MQLGHLRCSNDATTAPQTLGGGDGRGTASSQGSYEKFDTHTQTDSTSLVQLPIAGNDNFEPIALA